MLFRHSSWISIATHCVFRLFGWVGEKCCSFSSSTAIIIGREEEKGKKEETSIYQFPHTRKKEKERKKTANYRFQIACHHVFVTLPPDTILHYATHKKTRKKNRVLFFCLLLLPLPLLVANGVEMTEWTQKQYTEGRKKIYFRCYEFGDAGFFPSFFCGERRNQKQLQHMSKCSCVTLAQKQQTSSSSVTCCWAHFYDPTLPYFLTSNSLCVSPFLRFCDFVLCLFAPYVHSNKDFTAFF